MKWFNNGWYSDDYPNGYQVDLETYNNLNDIESQGTHYIATDKDGKPYLKEYEETNDKIINKSKHELNLTDWKVIRELEKLLLSDTDLHKTRQALRDKINELEQTNNGG